MSLTDVQSDQDALREERTGDCFCADEETRETTRALELLSYALNDNDEGYFRNVSSEDENVLEQLSRRLNPTPA